jgi:orotidine-5'-phosphate decarboxylase
MTPQAKARTFAEFFGASTRELYLVVAHMAAEWNKNDNVGVVVGATAVSELESVRRSVGDGIPILVPGVGAQGGDLERAIGAGSNSKAELAIINVARAVIFAGSGLDFQSRAREAALAYRERIGTAVENKIGNPRARR